MFSGLLRCYGAQMGGGIPIQSSGFKVQGSKFGVQSSGSEFEVQGPQPSEAISSHPKLSEVRFFLPAPSAHHPLVAPKSDESGSTLPLSTNSVTIGYGGIFAAP